jgi:hypothetical protein
MLLVLACGLWMGWRVNRANDQRREVAATGAPRAEIVWGFADRI